MSGLIVVSMAATVASVCMLASPIVTVTSMRRAKSIGVMTITFFCAQYANCVVWSMYGVQKLAPPVIICNILGTIIATYCVLTFLAVAKAEEAGGRQLVATTYKTAWLTAMGVLGLCGFLLFLILILRATVGKDAATTLNGFLGGCCSVIMLSSPLGMAKDIIVKKNAEGLQPLTMFFGTANSVLFCLYGILTVDVFMIVPNALCTVACFFQFFLLFRYGRHPSETVVVVPIDVAEIP